MHPVLMNSKDFLSKLKESNNEINEKIKKDGKDSVSVENFKEKEEITKPHIDMDIYVGVFEKKDKQDINNIKETTDKFLNINTNEKSNDNKKLIEEL